MRNIHAIKNSNTYRGWCGKIDNWVKGELSISKDKSSATILTEEGESLDVDVNSIGQSTTLCDRNGRILFEGDRVKYKHNSVQSKLDDAVGVIYYRDSAFMIRWDTGQMSTWMHFLNDRVLMKGVDELTFVSTTYGE